MMIKYCLMLGLLLATSGCAGTSVMDNVDKPIISKPDEPVDGGRCLVSNPKDVNMWINAMPRPGTGGKSLHAAFTVTTPTPGYQFALKTHLVATSSPAKVVLNLIATPPKGMVIQVIAQNKVNIKLANFPGSEGSPVQVNCGGKLLFKVAKVMAVH